MKCKYCDSIIPDNANSCPNCGAQVIHKDENKNEKAHTDKNKAGRSNKSDIRITDNHHELSDEENGEPETEYELSDISDKTEKGIDKPDNEKSDMKLVIGFAIFAVVFFIVGFTVLFIIKAQGNNSSSLTPESSEVRFNWSDVVLVSAGLPDPSTDKGEITVNTAEELTVRLDGINAGTFNSYVSGCEDKGYSVDPEKSDVTYSAFNSEGYRVSITFDPDESTMSIDVTSPPTLNNIKWPDTPLGDLLPKPKYKNGCINENSEDLLSMDLGGISADKYKDYVAEVKKGGYVYNEDESEKHYSAENEDGYRLTADYKGNNMISVSIGVPEYKVELVADCDRNIAFSKYNVKIYADDSLLGTLAHGTTETYSCTLKKGGHIFRFECEDDNTVKGTLNVNVSGDSTYKVNLHCTSLSVGVYDQTPGNESSSSDSQDNSSEESSASSDNSASSVTSSSAASSEVISSADAVKDDYSPGAVYDYAYERDLGEYSVYYMFDNDSKTVKNFSSNDTGVLNGTYTGDLDSGITITYYYDGSSWNEYFVFSGKNCERGVLTDGNGLTFDFKRTYASVLEILFNSFDFVDIN